MGLFVGLFARLGKDLRDRSTEGSDGTSYCRDDELKMMKAIEGCRKIVSDGVADQKTVSFQCSPSYQRGGRVEVFTCFAQVIPGHFEKEAGSEIVLTRWSRGRA